MLAGTSLTERPAAIRVDLGAIFVSMERSRSKWLITSLSPGGGDKKSKHTIAGPEFGAVLWSECLFRRFDNRRQVAAFAALAPTPWRSGQIDREQGVSKAGNPRLRATLIQLSWLWVRHQPRSALTLWFEERVKRNGGRLRKPMIVAMARKPLVALWKYVTAGVAIEGAVFSPA